MRAHQYLLVFWHRAFGRLCETRRVNFLYFFFWLHIDDRYCNVMRNVSTYRVIWAVCPKLSRTCGHWSSYQRVITQLVCWMVARNSLRMFGNVSVWESAIKLNSIMNYFVFLHLNSLCHRKILHLINDKRCVDKFPIRTLKMHPPV